MLQPGKSQRNVKGNLTVEDSVSLVTRRLAKMATPLFTEITYRWEEDLTRTRQYKSAYSEVPTKSLLKWERYKNQEKIRRLECELAWCKMGEIWMKTAQELLEADEEKDRDNAPDCEYNAANCTYDRKYRGSKRPRERPIKRERPINHKSSCTGLKLIRDCKVCAPAICECEEEQHANKRECHSSQVDPNDCH